MQITIVAVGKLKEKYWKQALDEYGKRLGAYAKVQIVEVADEPAPDQASPAQEAQIKDREGERIIKKIKSDAHVIALAIDGEQWDSEKIADQLHTLATYGKSHIVFVIGGSLGLSHDVLQRANQKLSFGNMTFPHQMMRVMLMEQVYRGFKIMRGEPYHK